MAKKNRQRDDYDEELEYNNEPEWVGITHSFMNMYIITHSFKDYVKTEFTVFLAKVCAYLISFWILTIAIFCVVDHFLGGILSDELFIELKDVWHDIFG